MISSGFIPSVLRITARFFAMAFLEILSDLVARYDSVQSVIFQIFIHLHILSRRFVADIDELNDFQEVRPVLQIPLHHRAPFPAHGPGYLRIAISGQIHDAEISVHLKEINCPRLSRIAADPGEIAPVHQHIEKRGFPTLDLPAKAISGRSSGGYCSFLTATAASSAFFIFISCYRYESLFENFIDGIDGPEFEIMSHILRSSSMSFMFSRGSRTFLTPALCAAMTFSFIPPTGSTFPRSVISPVMARSLRTGVFVRAETMDVHMVTRRKVRLSASHLPECECEYLYFCRNPRRFPATHFSSLSPTGLPLPTPASHRRADRSEPAFRFPS